MALRLLPGGYKTLLEPLTCKREILDLQLGGGTLRSLLEARLSASAKAKDFFTILANLWPSKELAEAFANETLDAEKQIAFSRLCGYPPTNMDAMKNLPADLKKLTYSDADLESMGKLARHFDYMAQFAYRDRNRERWNKEVLGG